MKMLTCREVTQLVSQGLDRKLGLGERIALRVHFLMCSGCGQFEKQMAFLRTAVRRLNANEDEQRSERG